MEGRPSRFVLEELQHVGDVDASLRAILRCTSSTKRRWLRSAVSTERNDSSG